MLREATYGSIGNRKDSTAGTDAGATPTTEDFTYDPDGNLTADGTLTYEWDGENRLAAVYLTSPGSGSKKLTFAYDYMGRRVQKQVYNRSGSAWVLETDQRFVYDGWNVVETLTPNPEPPHDLMVVRKYTWGLDLSGQTGTPYAQGIHGAGGIGGLLAVEETAATNSPAYWFFYDGNGNVGQVLKYVSGETPTITRVAHYEYDPYGQAVTTNNDVCDLEGTVITPDAGYANDNPFRFSTKWLDGEAGIGYWGKRYYWFRLGRWGSRDPIEEEGGLNLYAYVTNNAVGERDPLGLDQYPIGLGYGYNPQTRNEACACKNWLDGENDLSWLNDLPDCPCTVGGVKAAPGTWYPPESAPPTHPGATTCARSRPPTYPGSGQQCCYDGVGKLITGGPGAGTPDKVAPGGVRGYLRHFWNDVLPFQVCPLNVYLTKRPPNNGNNCSSNVR